MWYVVQVRTGEEKSVVNMCESIMGSSIEYSFFVPETVRLKRFCGKWHNIKKAMFPGYVFIESNQIQDIYEELKKIPVLTKILKTGMSITPLHEQEENRIRKLIDKDYVAEMSIGYIEGDKLIVQEGPLTGMEGMIKKIDRHKRIAVLAVDMMGGKVDVEVGLEILHKN